MRNTLNLSSRPFSNHRLLWLGTIAVFFIGALLLAWSMAETASANDQASKLRAEIADLEKQFNEARERENKKREAELMAVLTPLQQQQLSAARILVFQRSFSWDLLFTDLEPYVPKQAKISSIGVSSVEAEGDKPVAVLEIAALGSSAAQLTEMMESLQGSSGRFVVGEASQEQVIETGETPFRISVVYRQEAGRQ
jgi:hypothetical protein